MLCVSNSLSSCRRFHRQLCPQFVCTVLPSSLSYVAQLDRKNMILRIIWCPQITGDDDHCSIDQTHIEKNIGRAESCRCVIHRKGAEAVRVVICSYSPEKLGKSCCDWPKSNFALSEWYTSSRRLEDACGSWQDYLDVYPKNEEVYKAYQKKYDRRI